MNGKKVTAEVKLKVIGALNAGADMALAARAGGVSRSTLYNRMENDAEFAAQVHEAKDLADELIVKRLFDKAREGDTTAMIFWLKNRRPTEWRDRREHYVEQHTTDRHEYVAEFPTGQAVAVAPAPELPN